MLFKAAQKKGDFKIANPKVWGNKKTLSSLLGSFGKPMQAFQELPTPLTLVALCRPRLHLAVEGLGGRAGKPPRQNEGQKAGFLGKLRKKRIQKVWGGVVASEWQPPNLLNIKP